MARAPTADGSRSHYCVGSPDRVSRSGDAPILELRLVPKDHAIRGNDGKGPIIWTLQAHATSRYS